MYPANDLLYSNCHQPKIAVGSILFSKKLSTSSVMKIHKSNPLNLSKFATFYLYHYEE